MPKSREPPTLKQACFDALIAAVQTRRHSQHRSLNIQSLRAFLFKYNQKQKSSVESPFFETAIQLLEEFLELLSRQDILRIKLESADSFLNGAMRKLVVSKNGMTQNNSEIFLLQAASTKCLVKFRKCFASFV